MAVVDDEAATGAGNKDDSFGAASTDVGDAVADLDNAAAADSGAARNLDKRADAACEQRAGIGQRAGTIAVPPLAVSTVAPEPMVSPLSVSLLPPVASTTEPAATVAPRIVAFLVVSIAAPAPEVLSVPPEIVAPPARRTLAPAPEARIRLPAAVPLMTLSMITMPPAKAAISFALLTALPSTSNPLEAASIVPGSWPCSRLRPCRR